MDNESAKDPHLRSWSSADWRQVEAVTPVEGDASDDGLIAGTLDERRSFVKGLRYNLGGAAAFASAVLTDCETPAPLLFIGTTGDQREARSHSSDLDSVPRWIWYPSAGSPPPLPMSRWHRVHEGETKGVGKAGSSESTRRRSMPAE